MPNTKKIPTEVLMRAKVVVAPKPLSTAPLRQPKAVQPKAVQPKIRGLSREKVIAALKRLHPMD
jgi:hypothetical protein